MLVGRHVRRRGGRTQRQSAVDPDQSVQRRIGVSAPADAVGDQHGVADLVEDGPQRGEGSGGRDRRPGEGRRRDGPCSSGLPDTISHRHGPPATPSAAFGIGEKGSDNPVEMYLNDVFTVTVNMAGLPGLVAPAGLSGDGLPLGLQLIGRPFDEETLFALGETIEQSAGRTTLPEPWWA